MQVIDINAHVIKLVRNAVRKYASTEIPDFDEVRCWLGIRCEGGSVTARK